MKRDRRRHLCGIDTEDNGAGVPTHFAATHQSGAFYARTREAFLDKLETLAREVRHPLQVWATNLEYDIVNVFGERIAECRLQFGKSALCGATWRGIEFRDTTRHVPISVEAWGEFVGIGKAHKHLFNRKRTPTDAELLKRCQRDATITFRAADLLWQLYGKLGERPRMTLASTALALWQSRYGGKFAPVDAGLWADARAAYYGGRTQAMAVGTFEHVAIADVASMFPWAMTVAPLPLPWGARRRVAADAVPESNGIYYAEVQSELELPMLPHRTADGLQYPKGRWRGWYVGEELRAFGMAGGKIRVLAGHVFQESSRPYEKYIRSLYAKKQRARGAGRMLYKLFLNSLYGKAGQSGARVMATPVAKLGAVKHPPESWVPWHGLALYTREASPPPWSNNVWPAFVTARARVRLWQEMRELGARGARVLYCDTDSVAYVGERRYPKTAERIGDFEARGDFRKMLIVGRKEYALETAPGVWECHVKGVPREQRHGYLLTGRAEFDRPTKIRESSRTGKPANAWSKRTKQRRTDLSKRAAPDGTLAPPRVGRREESREQKDG